jgi:malate synthase
LFRSVLDEEIAKIKTQIGEKCFAAGKFDVARELFDKITTDDEFVEFLTLPGYEKLD